jgi:predicted peptidase
MKKELLLFLGALLCLFLQANAQTVIGHQNADRFPTDASGDSTYGLTYLPSSYAGNPTKKYPLILFLHGAGQVGSGLSGLNNLITDGLPKNIANGLQPSAVNPKDGQTYEFIVVSPQDANWSPNYNTIKYILPNILSKYHVDTTRIYITGLSAGGDGAWTVMGSGDDPFVRRFAAVATASSAQADGVNGLTTPQVEANLAKTGSVYGVAAWAVVGDNDGLDGNSINYINSINSFSPAPAIKAKYTDIAVIGHSAWIQLYDPAWRSDVNYYGTNCVAAPLMPNGSDGHGLGTGKTPDSLNVYEWFLLYTKGTAATTPTANAGSGQTITLPTNSITLTGSGTAGSGHTISSYGWTKISGGTATITSPSSASTTVTGLVQGTYVFRLTVTNNAAATATSDVTITVNAASGGTYAPPVITGGADQTITLPVDSVSLSSLYTLTGASFTSLVWTKFLSPGQTRKRLGIIGSSTSAGGGASTFDSSYVGRLKALYVGNGIVDSVIDLGQFGYNPYQAMPTGYVPPADVTTKLAPSDVPDPANNITALLGHHPTHVIINFPTNGFDVLTMPEIMLPFQKFADTLTSLGIIWYITTTQARSDEPFASQATQNFLQVVRDSLINRFGSHVINFYDNMVIPGTTQKIPAYDAGDGIHFNDLGHLQLFRQVVGANMFQAAAASPSVIATPSAQNTKVRGLSQGLNKFQVTVLDSHKQKNNAIVTITVNPVGGPVTVYPPCGSRHRYEITPNSDTAFWASVGGSPDVSAFQPGDTLAFPAHNTMGNYWTYITLDGFHGNPACPLVMTNEGGQTWVRGNTITISNSTYVKVTGSGTAGVHYGWLLTGTNPALRGQGPFSIEINNRSKNVEIDSVSIHNVGLGIQSETNPDCADSLDYPNWVLDSLLIHDNSIVGIWNEGMYIGITSPDNAPYDPRPVTCNGVTKFPIPMKTGYVRIWNNLVDSTGRGGIQLANAVNGVSEIDHNTVKHSGMNGDDAQGTAISLGLYTHAYIHDNTISDTYTWAIASIGACGTNIPIRIENNHMDSSGYLVHYDLSNTGKETINPATEPTLSDTLTYPYAIWVDTRQRLYTTDNPPGTAVHGQDSTQFWIRNNVIGRFKCFTSTRDNQSAIQIEDHSPGLQSTGNIICNNTSSLGQTIAIYTGNAGHPVSYSSNCSGTVAANAGSNQTITLPLDSVLLNGSGSSGTIASYLWTKVSGPNTPVIRKPDSVGTRVAGLLSGTYVFQLSLNSGASTSQVTVVVNPAGGGGGSGPKKGNQNVDRFPTDASGDSTYGLTWLPSSYASNPAKKYPLILFLHGSSQKGSGLSGLDTLITAGIPKLIANGFQPSAVDPRDGQTYEFIVVSPQDPGFTPNYNTIKYILPGILSRYHVDTSRIYFTGLIAGGDGVFTCLGSGDSSFIKKIAAAATASSLEADGVNGLTDVQVAAQFRNTSKKYGVRVWTVAGDQDGLIGADLRYHDSLNISSPTPPDKLTLIGGEGDTTWRRLYDTAYRPRLNYYGNTANCNNGCPSITSPDNNGSPVRGTGATQDSLNIYEWFLLYARGSGGVGGSAATPGTVSVVTQPFPAGGDTRIYPNPASTGQVTVEVANAERGKLKIGVYDLSGRLLRQYLFDKQDDLFRQTLDLGPVSKGLYVLKLQYETANKPAAVFKLIKE